MTTTTARQTAWDIVVECLRVEGIPYVFGLPGDPRHLYDALSNAGDDGPKAIGVRYETSGAFMAMAYARVSGRMAACFGCPGPGVANLVPGILEAYSGCTPMLVLGVRAPRQTNGMGAFQETDHLGMLRPITKWATVVETPETLAWTLRRAVSVARDGKPGPVYVELPADIGLAAVDGQPYRAAPVIDRPTPSRAAITEACDLIVAARRPLLIVGGGAYLARAGEAVAKLSEAFGIPIQTTPAGRSCVPEDHPLFVGLVGLYRTTVPREIYESADLIITVGSRMEEFQGGFLPRPADPRIIQIELDPFEIGRNWLPDVAVQADARKAVLAVIAELRLRRHQPVQSYVDEVTRRRAEAIAAVNAEADAAIASGAMPMRGVAIVNAVGRVFGRDTILVKENGGQDLWSYYWPTYQVLDTDGCVPPAEQTAMGYGVIGAMAAKLARPDRHVVCTTGDGAFQMSVHELGTAAQQKLPVTWVVLDDGAFGWVQWIQRRDLAGRIVATDFDPAVDLVGVAKASNCGATRVESADQLIPALEEAKRANAEGIPYVVVVPVDQSHHHAEFDRFHGFEPDPASSTF